MTYAAVPALRHDADLAREFEPGLCSPEYDFGLRPAAAKRGLLAGMSMTEKQGGSDVRAATTRAVPEGDAGHYRLTGHKWFTSAPMNDLFLTLAQAPGGLSCFVVPRVLPDGQRNAVSVLRLKDKLGNRSNASGEIEYDGALARRLGEEGRGVPTILEMVTMTRLDCVLGSAGQIRAGLSQAAYYAAHRRAFGRRLIEHEAMAAVLADLAVESWAATLTGLRLADLVDDRSPAAATLLRLALPAAKFWICKRAVPVLAEALENAWAATATWRPSRWPGCCARRRSTASGKARARSPRSMPCAPWAAARSARRRCWPNWPARPVGTRRSTRPCGS
jgi:putative acyl-CoA dehydrogenase